jgi:hypothetical protein
LLEWSPLIQRRKENAQGERPNNRRKEQGEKVTKDQPTDDGQRQYGVGNRPTVRKAASTHAAFRQAIATVHIFMLAAFLPIDKG